MALTGNDIKLFFSGGLSNTDPDQCLGGEMSTNFFVADRLFDNVTGTQTAAGYIDYRCVYFHNISSTDTLFNGKVFISSEVVGGSNVTIGLEINNERQDIYLTNATSVASGSFILQYYDFSSDSDIQFTVNYDSSMATWTSNFQSALNAINGLENVFVTGSYIGTTAYFQIYFNGSSGYRFYENLQLVSLSNSFLDVNATLTIQKVINGGPKLKTAANIGLDTTAPNGVSFFSTSVNSPINIGDLKPQEYFPVWIKRVVVSNVTPLDGDGFTIKLKGDII